MTEPILFHVERVRRMCMAQPHATEKRSHGEPTFFVHNKVFAMLAMNHHGDGRLAVWIPVSVGTQELLIQGDPETYFRPPYVGVRGWVGIDLKRVDDEALSSWLRDAWMIVAPKRLRNHTDPALEN